jgi:hypothetical protein
MNDGPRYQIWRGDGGYWSWSARLGADSVYGGFESHAAAEADAIKTLSK